MGYNFNLKTTGETAPAIDRGGFVNLTLKSRNKKVGPVPVSTSGRETCPSACPLKDGPCYADGGPLSLFWQKVTDQKAGANYRRFIASVAALPIGQFWRHNQAGDLKPCSKDPETIDGPALVELVEANHGKAGFTFTHYDVIKNAVNNFIVTAANRNGFTINLSGNNVHHADELIETGAGPVVTVLPVIYERKTQKAPAGKEWAETLAEYKSRLETLPTTTPAGARLVVCPATYKDDTACVNCRLCQKAGRKTVVGFPAHGRSRRKADAVARGVV